jgi:hypothetical protein
MQVGMSEHFIQDWALLWEQPKSCWYLVEGVAVDMFVGPKKHKGLCHSTLHWKCRSFDSLKRVEG